VSVASLAVQDQVETVSAEGDEGVHCERKHHNPNNSLQSLFDTHARHEILLLLCCGRLSRFGVRFIHTSSKHGKQNPGFNGGELSLETV